MFFAFWVMLFELFCIKTLKYFFYQEETGVPLDNYFFDQSLLLKMLIFILNFIYF